MDKTLQKKEAIERMKILGLHPNVIKDFKQGILNYSEKGILFWVNDEWKKYIENFEQEYNCLVYHIIHNQTEFGELLTMLYVSDDKEEWSRDRQDLKECCAYAYVENIDDPYCSEIGYVAIKPLFGGVIRLY